MRAYWGAHVFLSQRGTGANWPLRYRSREAGMGREGPAGFRADARPRKLCPFQDWFLCSRFAPDPNRVRGLPSRRTRSRANSLGGAPATNPTCIGCKVLPACHHPDGRCLAGRVRVSIAARLRAGTDGNHPAAREDSEAASGPRRFPSSSAVHVGHDSTGAGVLPIRRAPSLKHAGL